VETAAIETFTAGSFDRHPTDIAALRGARYVRSSETEQGRSWAQSRIKLLTGGDPVKARFMHKNEFTYIPQFKLNFDGNHKPKLRNFGDAERDRFNIAHFDRRPAKPNPDLAEQLKSEGSEILAWAISGCLDWQQNGLIRPKAMVDATEAYFAENDHKQRWFDDHCERGDYAETNAALRESWQEFAREQGITYISQSELSDWLIEQGFEPIKNKHGIRGRGFKGLRITTIDIDYDTTGLDDEL
jgi:putative DNA primase/helicase